MFSKSVEAWRPLAAQFTSLPTNFILAWIAIESDGEFPHRSHKRESIDTPKYDERGPMEVSWPEASEILRMDSSDFAKLLDDKAYSIQSGVYLALYYRDKWLNSYVPNWDDINKLRAVKATHAGGMGFFKSLYKAVRGFYGRDPGSWEELRAATLTILKKGGTYVDVNGATQSLPSNVKDLAPRIIAQIDKLDTLMGGGTRSGPHDFFPGSPSLPGSGHKVPLKVVAIAGAGAAMLLLLGARK